MLADTDLRLAAGDVLIGYKIAQLKKKQSVKNKEMVKAAKKTDLKKRKEPHITSIAK
jgi:hypothetical protein